MLKISKDLQLPTDFATQTVAILARKRVGKTYTASVLAEECCENKIPFVVLDPTGAWYGLRSTADGRHAGYPVIIIGGAHGDIPLEFSAGKLIAEFVVENPGYYVLDLSGSESDAEQDRFATAFAQRLYRLKDKHRDPLHLFVDEADSFAPQTPFPNQRPMLGAFEAIVRRGGIRGLGMTMITQRSAVLNNNVLMQAEVLINLQTTGPADIEAVKKWVKLNATKEQQDEFLSSLASLKTGEAWVWSPVWLEVFKKVQIRERRTFNSSATPKVGEKKIEPAKLADVDLAALSEKMSATIEKVKSEDPKILRKKIVDLERELANRPTETKTEQVTVEVPVFPASLAGAVDLKLENIGGYVFGIEKELKQIREDCLAIRSLITEEAAKAKAAPHGLAHAVASGRSFQNNTTTPTNFRELQVPRPSAPTLSHPSTLPEGEKKCLIVAAQTGSGATREQITILSGYKRSTRDAYIQRLGQKGYVTVSGGLVSATAEGIAALGSDYEPLPTGRELQDYWLERLPEGEAKVLRVALNFYPRGVDRDTISQQTDYKRSTRDAYIQRLGVRKLVSASGGLVTASENLF